MKKKLFVFFILSALVVALLNLNFSDAKTTSFEIEKINGVNFVAPIEAITSNDLQSVKELNAEWISIIPYAYTPKNSGEVIYFEKHPRWWGEGIKGVVGQIVEAKKAGLKIMLKPHVWVIGDGWPGDFLPGNEEEWTQWENTYRNYILRVASVADSMNVDLFCFSTEYKRIVIDRPEYWHALIKDIKTIYSGKLTYAANWDNYENVTFWKELDYIGIDAYFPLNDEKTPSTEALEKEWKTLLSKLNTFSNQIGKSILFAEYGYESCDFTSSGHWNNQNKGSVNLIAQKNAYEALFKSVWDKDFIAGGFLWKWYAPKDNESGPKDVNYTPQNKPAEEIIREYYGKF